MDFAQALSGKQNAPDSRGNDGGKEPEQQPERPVLPSAIQAERRRSTYEKYSNIMMPILREEKTPASTPAGTLTKTEVASVVASGQGSKVPDDTVAPPADIPRRRTDSAGAHVGALNYPRL